METIVCENLPSKKKADVVFREIFTDFPYAVGDKVTFNYSFMREEGKITHIDQRGKWFYVCMDVNFGKYKRLCLKGKRKDYTNDMRIVA